MNASFARRLLVALPVILLAGCPGGSIYYTLEHETKVVDNTLPNTLTVSDVTGAAGGPYYVAAGRIWKGTVTPPATVSWDVANPVAPPATGALCNALVAWPPAAPTMLLGGFVAAGGNLGLYESDAFDPVTSWTAVSAFSGKQVVRLKTDPEGPTLLVIAATTTAPFTYELHFSTDGATFAPSLTGGTAMINDAVYAGAAIGWCVTQGGTLFRGATLDALSVESSIPVGTGEALRDLLFYGATLCVSSSLGNVFYTGNGTSWATLTAPAVSGVVPPLFGFAGPIGGAGGRVLVGSDGYGYYELAGSPFSIVRATDTLSPNPAITTLRLYNAAIRRFFPDGSRVFACTAGTGLWRGEISGTGAAATITWLWE